MQLGFQGVRAYDSPRRDYPDDVPLHQTVGKPGVLDLFGNGDLQTLFQQTIEVPLRTVVRHPAHGDGLTLLFLAGGQCDVKGVGSHEGIFMKQFVEVPHAKKEKRFPGLGFQACVLFHHGGELGIGNRAVRSRGPTRG